MTGNNTADRLTTGLTCAQSGLDFRYPIWVPEPARSDPGAQNQDQTLILKPKNVYLLKTKGF